MYTEILIADALITFCLSFLHFFHFIDRNIRAFVCATISGFIRVACPLSSCPTSCRLKIFPDFTERAGRVLRSAGKTTNRWR